MENFGTNVCEILSKMQHRMLETTKSMRESKTVKVDTREEFTKALDEGKFILAHRDGTTETEEAIKEKTKATIRCIPYNDIEGDLYPEQGSCILTGKPSSRRVLFAIAY